MKRRPVLVLAVALLCGGLAWYLMSRYLHQQLSPLPTPKVAVSRVAVAARDLPGGSVLRAEDVKLVEWPATARPAGYVESADALVGQGLILPVRADEPLLQSKLAGAGVSGLAASIPAGMRAVSVKVDEVIAVAGFVVPGTRVDVLATIPPSGDMPGSSRVVLQNIKVLAAGQSFDPTAQGKPQDATVITLLVTPAEAEALALAANEGRIQLALRNTLDEALAIPVGAESRLQARIAPPAPAAAPPAQPAPARAPATSRNSGRPVEIYHGSARSVTSF
jgi:pilus assembly protein CpaB